MKIVKIILISLLVLTVLAVVGLFVFVKTFDISKHKDQITQTLSDTLKRKVTLEDVDLDLDVKRGVNLQLKGLSIAEDSQFGSDPFLQVGSALLHVDVMSYVKNRLINVTALELINPIVRVIQDGEVVNIQTLAAEGSPKVSVGQSVDENSVEKPTMSSTPQIPDLVVKSIKIVNGQLLYKDLNQNPAMILPIQQLNLAISDFSIGKPFMVELTAAVLMDQPNIDMKGLANVNLNSTQVRVDDFVFKTSLSQWPLDQLKSSMAALEGLEAIKEWQGDLVLNITQAIIGQKGVLQLKTKGSFDNGHFLLKDIPSAIENLKVGFDADESDASLTTLSLNFAGGSISGQGKVDDYLKSQKADFKVSFSDIQIEKLLSPEDIPVNFTGKVKGDLTAKVKGLTDPELLNKLESDIQISIQEARVKDLNILKLVLDQTGVASEYLAQDIKTQLEKKLPDEYKDLLTTTSVDVQQGDVTVKLRSGEAVVQIVAEAKDFLLKSQGQITVDQSANLVADYFFPAKLSEALIDSIPELRSLLNDKQQIHIPAKSYKGPLAKASLLPDTQYMIKKVGVGKVKSEAKKAIFKALDLDLNSKPTSDVADTTSATDGDGEVEQPSTEEVLIDSLLNKFLPAE